MRQVAGAFMEYEKGRLVAKRRGAGERKRKENWQKGWRPEVTRDCSRVFGTEVGCSLAQSSILKVARYLADPRGIPAGFPLHRVCESLAPSVF